MLTEAQTELAQRRGWDVGLCVDEKTRRAFPDIYPYPHRERWSRPVLFAFITKLAKANDPAALATLKVLAGAPTKGKK